MTIKFIGQLFLSIIFCIVVLEGYFKLLGIGGQEFLQPDLKMGCRHIPNKQVIWRMEGYSKDKINSVGLRDSEHQIAKEAGVYRIALIGDSVVEALQVPLNETFGKVLESILNKQSLSNKIRRFEIINFGCSSYSSGQELLQYEQEAGKYQPDAVVLLYNRGDSLENVINAKDRKRAEPRPYFYLDQAGQLQEDDSVLQVNINKLKLDPCKEFLRKNSAIYGVLSQADLSLTLNEPRYGRVKGWLTSLSKLSSRPLLLKSAYKDQNSMAITEALIERIATEAVEKKRIFILTIFPNIVHYDILTEQAKQLKALAQKKQFGYLDLSSSFLADKDPMSNFILYHFSSKGHQTTAKELFKVIDARLKLSKQADQLSL